MALKPYMLQCFLVGSLQNPFDSVLEAYASVVAISFGDHKQKTLFLLVYADHLCVAEFLA